MKQNNSHNNKIAKLLPPNRRPNFGWSRKMSPANEETNNKPSRQLQEHLLNKYMTSENGKTAAAFFFNMPRVIVFKFRFRLMF